MSASSVTPADEPLDRLTIGRLMLLTAGIGVSLPLYVPELGTGDPRNPETWRILVNAVVVGLAMPAPLICLAGRSSGRRLGAGGMFALVAGLGVLLLLPPALINWYLRITANTKQDYSAAACLYFVLPPLGLWYLLAALLAGHAGRESFRKSTPWTEKYGYSLALLWTPLGLWQLFEIYRDTLK